MTAYVESLTKDSGDSAREALGVVGLPNAKLDDGELVPAQAGQCVSLTQARPEPIGHRYQKSIAYRMAQSIVHLFEIVQIEADHRELSATTCHDDRLFHPVPEQYPVGQSG